MKKSSLRLPKPKPRALALLSLELPLILAAAVSLLIAFLTDRAADPLGAAYRYAELLPYITVSLVISIGSALLADLTERERENKA